MNVGSFYRRIQLKLPTSSSMDRFGQTMVMYTTSSIWADVRQVGGGETDTNGYVHSTANYEFIIRRTYMDYGNVVNEKAIINWNGIDYNVVFAQQVGKLYWKLSGERRISNA